MCSKSKTTNTVELPSNGCMDTEATKSQVDGGVTDGDSLGEAIGTTEVPLSGFDGKYGLEHRHLHHAASTLPAGAEYLVPQTQPELVGHSIACLPYPYSNPYYGGLMTTYGTQALVNPHLLGMHQQARMCLPLEMTEDPVYVNPKQYNGIMRRRKSRAKAELERKLIKNRKPYLHESRHQHAMRRERGCGGRFLNKKKVKEGANPTREEHMECGGATTSGKSTSPSGNGQEGEYEGVVSGQQHHHHDADAYKDGNSSCCFYGEGQEYKVSSEGDCSGQLRGSILVRQRALTIQ